MILEITEVFILLQKQLLKSIPYCVLKTASPGIGNMALKQSLAITGTNGVAVDVSISKLKKCNSVLTTFTKERHDEGFELLLPLLQLLEEGNPGFSSRVES